MMDDRPASDRVATEAPERWWGRRRLSDGGVASWEIGPFRLAVLNDPYEWQVAREQREESGGDGDETWSFHLDRPFPEEPEHVDRFLFREDENLLAVTPALANRPVVASPRTPVYLLPGEQATLFVGSPLWARIEVEDPPRQLTEVPIVRPSDTWFGPNTRQGELCYASRTRARVDYERLPVLVRYAITPLVIRNHAATPLPVESLKLPVPLLALYAAADGRLWTQEVTFTRELDGDVAGVEVHPGAPSLARGGERVQGPRTVAERGLLTRAFSGLSSIFERKEGGDG